MSIRRAPSVKIAKNLKMSGKKSQKANESKFIKNLFLTEKYEDCLQVCSVFNCVNEIQKKIIVAGCWTHLGLNFEQAAKNLYEVITVEPNNSFAHYGLGLNYYFQGELEKCLTPFTRALELNQASMQRALKYKNCAIQVTQLLNEAKSEFALKNYDSAIEIISKATLVDPENSGIKKMVKNMSDQFLQKLVRQLENDLLVDENIEVKLNQIEFLIKSYKLEEAAKKFAEFDHKLTARGWFLKGNLSYLFGSLKLSMVEFNKALEIDKKMKKTQIVFEKAAKFVELIEGASGHMSLKENSAAEEMLTRALEVDVENKRIVQAIYFQRAMCKLNMGRQHEAFDDYLQFEALQNQTGMVMDGIKF